MELKFAKLNEAAKIPFKAEENAAGFDLVANKFEYDGINEIVTYDTQVAVEIPEVYVGLLFPRSSVYKTDLILANCVGVIDSSYRGPIMLKYKTTGEKKNFYRAEERVGQLVIVENPYFIPVEVPYEELSKTRRGTGGFGSTGK